MSYDIGFVLDGLILVFLSVTIFYAARLSLFMKYFRDGREGMKILIRDLSVTIDKAEQSIATMKAYAQQNEQEMREIIKESKFLSDELRFMNETGDSLANRLEKLADRNRELVDLMENAGGIGTQRIRPYEPPKPTPRKKQVETYDEDPFEIQDFEMDDDDERDFLALSDGAYREEEAYKSKVNTEAKSKVRSFAIFDREFMDSDDKEQAEASKSSESSHLHSRAEQDLYEALQRKKRVSEIS